MNDDEDINNGNVFRFGTVTGGKTDTPSVEDGIPINDYIIHCTDGDDYYARGFLIFTPHHLAIMRDEGKGAIPVLVLPISKVHAAELYEDNGEEDEEVPF